MLAEQSLHQGHPQDALVQLQESVRKDPSNPKLRTFLFQLLAVLGQWERALTQLNVAGDLDAANLAMVQTYREAISCEVLRKEIFAGQKTPLIFGDPTQWIALSLEALKLTALNQHQQARELREQAFDLAPATSGTIDDQAFDWIADADSRLGPVLEAIVNGRYYWIPFFQISAIQIEKPCDLRDMVWTPAHFDWVNGGEAFGLIPTRYPGSENAEDSAIRLARKTEWQEQAKNVYIGYGQRLLTTNNNDYALMDIRKISFNK
jgi:type VI secretion system protein ImpE